VKKEDGSCLVGNGNNTKDGTDGPIRREKGEKKLNKVLRKKERSGTTVVHGGKEKHPDQESRKKRKDIVKKEG